MKGDKTVNILDRLFLTVGALILLLISIGAISFSTSIISINLLRTGLDGYYGRWEVGVIAVIPALICIRILILALKTERTREVIVQDNSVGRVGISYSAIESLVAKVVEADTRIKDSKVSLKSRDGGLYIGIRLTIDRELIIPEMAQELQNNVKEFIENTSGTVVKKVVVNVDKVEMGTIAKTI